MDSDETLETETNRRVAEGDSSQKLLNSDETRRKGDINEPKEQTNSSRTYTYSNISQKRNWWEEDNKTRMLNET